MSRAGNEFGGPAKQRSGWLIPLGVFLVTAVLTGLVLLYYLSPTPSELIEEQAAPTDSSALVALTVGRQGFHIPANYIPFASARKGGTLDELTLVALLPDLQGYATGEAQAFADNSAESRVVNFTIRNQAILAERDRMARIYLPQVQNRDGTPGPYELTQYAFRADSGYRDEEMFVGDTDKGPMVLRCTKPAPDAVAPSCLRDMPLGPNLALSYRFKRAHLPDWREIDSSVRALIGAFMDKS